MKRLYQWFSERASLFLSDTGDRGQNRTLRTEVTTQREATTLMVSGGTSGFDLCPLCGQKVVPVEAEQTSPHLRQASMSQKADPMKDPFP
jgi:hypothetical protein